MQHNGAIFSNRIKHNWIFKFCGYFTDNMNTLSFKLLEMYKNATRQPPKMWGASMIGFGQYHYKSERSSQEGDWPLAAFSPRKASLTLYVMPGVNDYSDLLEKLGKHKTSKGCLYINKLADVDLDVLQQIIKKSYGDAKAQYSS